MNLRDLHYLVAVAETLHFGRAAKRCFVSQPALSGQIRKLEAELSLQLFERTSRSVVITDDGRELVAYAREMLELEQVIYDYAASRQNPFGGTLRLGAFPTLAPYIFPKIVDELSIAMPDLRLVLIEEKTHVLVQLLRTGELDAALLAQPITEQSFACAELFTDPFYLAVPAEHPLAQVDVVDSRLPEQSELLLLEEGHCLRDQALDVCDRMQVTERQDFRATSLETVRQMVRAASGITLVPKIAIERDDPLITYIPFSAPAPSRSIALFWRRSSPRQAVFKRLSSVLSVSTDAQGPDDDADEWTAGETR